ncbi:MAG: glycosyltransferase family 4 protein [Planctomycetales bacterium]|nr:glycosyltransferase family 4 protein [bacterium]UNM09756.1 MAG: glycosyltransferase family 4 protein [Planctomycetales bacterium]
MRIAFFTTRMMLGYGVDLTIHEIARRMVEQHEIEVDVWTPTSDGTYDDAPYKLQKITVYGGERNRILPVLERNANIAMEKLAKELTAKEIRYDLVIPCTHPYYNAARHFRCPGVFFNFGNVPTTGFSWKGKLNWEWLDISERYWLKRRASMIISISQFLHRSQPREFWHKGRVLHLGGDHYRAPANKQTRLRFCMEHGIPPRSVILGFVGRLHRNHPPYKGTGELLEIARRMLKDNPEACIVMAGIGSEDDAAWVREAGAIPVLNLPPRDMPDFYRSIDIYLCASKWEGFNLPIVEAAWHGVPSIAYNVGAHGEHVTAMLINGGLDELYAAALKLSSDEGLRRQLSSQALARAQQFSWDKVTTRMLEYLRELTL